MFFNIGPVHLENYPCHWQLGSFSVSTDNGWNLVKQNNADILYKGYADRAVLKTLLDEIADQDVPALTGNFCAIVHANDKIKIQTDRYRSFPIYINEQRVNNLVPLSRTAWADSLVTIHEDLSTIESKFNVVGDIETSTLSCDDVINSITELVDQKTASFVKYNTLPVRVFLSGGVDSMLVYSFLQKFTNNYKIVKCSHIDYDYFYLKNSGDISKHWAYNQIHHWADPCVLTSGAPGDEFMLRSPTTADLWLKEHNTGIIELLDDPQWSDCLHNEYFKKPSNYSIFQNQTAPTTPWDLCNIIVNDWQHWHLGHTLTWTPLRDLEIFKLMLRLPMDSAIEQVMNSETSIKLIERNSPGLSKFLSDKKNVGNVLSNLPRLILNETC